MAENYLQKGFQEATSMHGKEKAFASAAEVIIDDFLSSGKRVSNDKRESLGKQKDEQVNLSKEINAKIISLQDKRDQKEEEVRAIENSFQYSMMKAYMPIVGWAAAIVLLVFWIYFYYVSVFYAATQAKISTDQSIMEIIGVTSLFDTDAFSNANAFTLLVPVFAIIIGVSAVFNVKRRRFKIILYALIFAIDILAAYLVDQRAFEIIKGRKPNLITEVMLGVDWANFWIIIGLGTVAYVVLGEVCVPLFSRAMQELNPEIQRQKEIRVLSEELMKFNEDINAMQVEKANFDSEVKRVQRSLELLENAIEVDGNGLRVALNSYTKGWIQFVVNYYESRLEDPDEVITKITSHKEALLKKIESQKDKYVFTNTK